MTPTTSRLTNLRRPRLLIRAARHGLGDYDRDSALGRLIDRDPRQTSDDIVRALLAAEAEIESHRKSGQAIYSLTRHIELLVALMCEARRLSKPPQMA